MTPSLVRRAVLSCLLVAITHAVGHTAAPPVTLDEALARDAALLDVEMADEQRCWAVGQRGVILHSHDGGQTWQPQSSGYQFTLHSVSFVDQRNGWAVGGTTIPYTHRSEGIVLRTTDGGAAWQRVSAPLLPRMVHVQFFDTEHGVAIGETSPTCASGIFVTQDGGRTWLPQPADEQGYWRAASFADPQTGVLVASDGSWSRVATGEVQAAGLAPSAAKLSLAIKMLDTQHGWRGGIAGLVEVTHDGGRTWQPPRAAPLHPAAAAWFDAHAIAAHERHVWIAGTPGTRILHSRDGGATWQLQTTGSRATIEALDFADQQHGCAVGDLGTILVTHDGGDTWQTARTGGDHAAVWMATTGPHSAAVELVAHVAAGQGYVTSVHCPLATPPAAARVDQIRRQYDDALMAAGAARATSSATLVLPSTMSGVNSVDQLVAQLDQQTETSAVQLLARQLVRELRTWQPDVVVLPHTHGAHPDAVSELVATATREAIAIASDATQCAELAEVFDLAAHSPKRVAGLLPRGEQGNITVDLGEYLPAIGTTPAYYATSARGVLHTEFTAAPPLCALDVLEQQPGLVTERSDLLGGIFIAHNSGARRLECQVPLKNLDELRQLTQHRQHLVELLEYTTATPEWTSRVVNLTGGMGSDAGGELLFELAETYRTTSRYDLAADTYYLLGRRYPESPLVERGLAWLVTYYASAEVAHAAEQRQRKPLDLRPLASVSAVPPTLPAASEQITAQLTRDDRWQRAKLLGEYLNQVRPALGTGPQLATPLATLQRKLGSASDAERYFQHASRTCVDPPWWRVALAERWLAEPHDALPDKPITRCVFVAERPQLDGSLDEPMWQQATPIEIAEQRGKLWLACDEDFLYLAIECTTTKSVAEDSAPAKRLRDTGLTSYDRMAVTLDTDRDYATGYELVVDQRGWTNDFCWGDRQWDPTWYVAQQQDAAKWRAEAAIAWSEMTDGPPDLRSAWAIGVTHHTSQGSATAWPASDSQSPDRFGLLIFE